VSAVIARTALKEIAFDTAWRSKGTGTILAIVDLGSRDARLTFDSAADARRVAAECIKAAEAMERLAAEGSAAPAGKDAGDGS
jgi:hypothetical protein